MSNVKKWALGICIIIMAIAGAIVALLDNDPNTNVDTNEVVENISDGINVIKADNESEK